MNPDAPYPRDLAGYGEYPPHARWPGGARIAVQFVLNYEEGGENAVLHGDAASETFLSDIVGAQAFRDAAPEHGVALRVRLARRRLAAAALFRDARRSAHRLRRGAWRCDGTRRSSTRSCATATRSPAHGWRWISYQDVDEATEREHLARAVEAIARLTGRPPAGWYTGRDSPNTRRLVVEHGGFVYDADSYADDLPYWTEVDVRARARAAPRRAVHARHERHALRHAAGLQQRRPVLRVPARRLRHALRRRRPAGLDRPKMLSIGLHCRIAGRPARLAALARFLDYARSHDGVWFARRIDIARHWIATHPAEGSATA